jgi:hypothetical protein
MLTNWWNKDVCSSNWPTEWMTGLSTESSPAVWTIFPQLAPRSCEYSQARLLQVQKNIFYKRWV